MTHDKNLQYFYTHYILSLLIYSSQMRNRFRGEEVILHEINPHGVNVFYGNRTADDPE